jgi:hypothetical protein
MQVQEEIFCYDPLLRTYELWENGYAEIAVKDRVTEQTFYGFIYMAYVHLYNKCSPSFAA